MKLVVLQPPSESYSAVIYASTSLKLSALITYLPALLNIYIQKAIWSDLLVVLQRRCAMTWMKTGQSTRSESDGWPLASRIADWISGCLRLISQHCFLNASKVRWLSPQFIIEWQSALISNISFTFKLQRLISQSTCFCESFCDYNTERSEDWRGSSDIMEEETWEFSFLNRRGCQVEPSTTFVIRARLFSGICFSFLRSQAQRYCLRGFSWTQTRGGDNLGNLVSCLIDQNAYLVSLSHLYKLASYRSSSLTWLTEGNKNLPEPSILCVVVLYIPTPNLLMICCLSLSRQL